MNTYSFAAAASFFFSIALGFLEGFRHCFLATILGAVIGLMVGFGVGFAVMGVERKFGHKRFALLISITTFLFSIFFSSALTTFAANEGAKLVCPDQSNFQTNIKTNSVP